LGAGSHERWPRCVGMAQLRLNAGPRLGTLAGCTGPPRCPGPCAHICGPGAALHSHNVPLVGTARLRIGSPGKAAPADAVGGTRSDPVSASPPACYGTATAPRTVACGSTAYPKLGQSALSRPVMRRCVDGKWTVLNGRVDDVTDGPDSPPSPGRFTGPPLRDWPVVCRRPRRPKPVRSRSSFLLRDPARDGQPLMPHNVRPTSPPLAHYLNSLGQLPD
jgi:hypothetical protein